MKTKFYIYTALLSGFLIFPASCKKMDTQLNRPGINMAGDTWTKGNIDAWIFNNYTKPYNIEVKYKWDRTELTLDKTLVPPQEDKVIPVMDAVLKTWIMPYTAIAGEDFVKKYSHKQFVLTGSAEYNENGTRKVGEAEGGRKVVLYEINQFDKNNKPAVRQMLHTIQHEFAHILNQNIAVTPDYKKITPAGYTSTWFNSGLGEALNLGFITPYSRSNPDEDFVEMLTALLVEGQARFNYTRNSLFIINPPDPNTGKPASVKKNAQGIYEPNMPARDALRQKEGIVKSYLLDAFGIDLAALQAKTQQAIEALSPTPGFNTLLGPDNTYQSITINPQKLSDLSPLFLEAYDTANTKLQTKLPGFYIDHLTLLFTNPDEMTLQAAIGKGDNIYKYNFVFDLSHANNGIISLKYRGDQPAITTSIARDIEKSVADLINYFDGQQFQVRWIDDKIPQSKGFFGGLVNANDPGSFVYGTLK